MRIGQAVPESCVGGDHLRSQLTYAGIDYEWSHRVVEMDRVAWAVALADVGFGQKNLLRTGAEITVVFCPLAEQGQTAHGTRSVPATFLATVISAPVLSTTSLPPVLLA